MSGRLFVAGALVVLAAAGAARPARAQPSLASTAAWEHLGQDMPTGPDDFAFTGDAAGPTVWTLDGYGLRKLDPGGGTWTTVDHRLSAGLLHFDLFGSPPDTLFAGGVLHRSVDGGRTFREVTSPVATEGRLDSDGALARIPRGAPFAGRLVAGDPDFDGDAVVETAFVYSDDGGDTWTRAMASPQLSPFRMHAFRSGRVLAAGFYGAVLSDDGGRNFRTAPDLYESTRVSFDLTHMAVLGGFATGRAGDSAEGRVLIVGTQAGRSGDQVWASDDEGTSWRRVRTFAPESSSWGGLTAVPASAGGGPGWAVATSGYGIVSATVDGGGTWAVVGQVPEVGFINGRSNYVTATAVGPDGRLYVGTSRIGNEDSWSWKSKSRVADAIRLIVAGEAAPESDSEPVGVSMSLRPNPVAGRAEVVLSLAEAQDVRAVVHDALGRELAVIHAGLLAAGEQAVSVDTSAWPPGVYVVRVTAGGRVVSARLTVVR